MTVVASARREGRNRWSTAVGRAAVVLVLAGCAPLGPPPMEPVTATTLAEAERRWEASGVGSYRLVVRVRAPRFAVAVYEVVVADGRLVAVARDGRSIAPEDARHYDYSVAGLFRLMRDDLRLADVPRIGDTPPVDLRARFAPDTGRLVRYRRTVGSARRRVLMVEVLEYRPGEPALDGARSPVRTSAAVPKAPSGGPAA